MATVAKILLLDIAFPGFVQASVPVPAVRLVPVPALEKPAVVEFPGGQIADEDKAPVSPGQMVTPVVGGEGMTATKTVSELEQPFAVPVTV